MPLSQNRTRRCSGDGRQGPILLLLSPYVAVPRTPPDSSRRDGSCSPADARPCPWPGCRRLRLGGRRRRDHGTVTFHEDDPDRTLQVYGETAHGHLDRGRVAQRPQSRTTASYSVGVPAGVPVKLRVALRREVGYWYGDGFDAAAATPVEAPAGSAVGGIDLDSRCRSSTPAGSWTARTARRRPCGPDCQHRRRQPPPPCGADPRRRIRRVPRRPPGRHGGSWYEAGVLGFAGNDTAGRGSAAASGSEPELLPQPAAG